MRDDDRNEGCMKQIAKMLSVAIFGGFAMNHFALFAKAQTTSQQAVLIAQRNTLENQLESVAIIECKVMVVMRDVNNCSDNCTESNWKVADNVVHHSEQYPSSIVLSIAKR